MLRVPTPGRSGLVSPRPGARRRRPEDRPPADDIGRLADVWPPPDASGGFWELPTGSRIAWARVPAKGPRRPTRVVFSSPGALAPALDAAAAAGSCDYLSWSSGLAYRHALPRAELV